MKSYWCLTCFDHFAVFHAYFDKAKSRPFAGHHDAIAPFRNLGAMIGLLGKRRAMYAREALYLPKWVFAMILILLENSVLHLPVEP